MPAPIRLMIVDDHSFFRQSLAQVCREQTDLELVAEAANGYEAVALARYLRPDIILMDLQMPLLDGLQATALITAENPAIRVLMLTIHTSSEIAGQALAAGARACLSKDIDLEGLLATIQDVYTRRGTPSNACSDNVDEPV